MQTLSFHQSNRAPTERLIFNCHQEAKQTRRSPRNLFGCSRMGGGRGAFGCCSANPGVG
jgi:hypothetical protein